MASKFPANKKYVNLHIKINFFLFYFLGLLQPRNENKRGSAKESEQISSYFDILLSFISVAHDYAHKHKHMHKRTQINCLYVWLLFACVCVCVYWQNVDGDCAVCLLFFLLITDLKQPRCCVEEFFQSSFQTCSLSLSRALSLSGCFCAADVVVVFSFCFSRNSQTFFGWSCF